MQPRLDAVVICSEDTPSHFVRPSIDSVEVAAARAGNVNVVVSKGVPGHIGNARRNALDLCKSEYVCFVDDDDLVLPNAFTCLDRHYDSAPSAIHAREIRLLHNGRLQMFNARHHLTAYRRDCLERVDFSKYAAYDKQACHNATDFAAVDELSWVYVWRVYLSKGAALRTRRIEELRI